LKNLFLILVVISLASCSRRERVGARCYDGWRSYATGSGACSHHGGVDYWIYEND